MNTNIVFHGDSITNGSSVLTPYPSLLDTILANAACSVTIINEGQSGYGFNTPSSGVSTLITNAAALVDPYAGGGSVLVVFAGTNDISQGGAATYSYFQTYLADRLAAGWAVGNIIVLTMLPRGVGSEIERSILNSSFANGAVSSGYKIVRLDQDQTIGQPADYSNTTYYYDGLHPTLAGHQIIADLVLPVIATVLPRRIKLRLGNGGTLLTSAGSPLVIG